MFNSPNKITRTIYINKREVNGLLILKKEYKMLTINVGSIIKGVMLGMLLLVVIVIAIYL